MESIRTQPSIASALVTTEIDSSLPIILDPRIEFWIHLG